MTETDTTTAEPTVTVTETTINTNPLEETVALIELAAASPDNAERDGTKLRATEVIRQGEVYIMKVDGRRMNKRKVDPLSTTDLTEGRSTTAHTVTGPVTLYPAVKGDIAGVLPTALRGPALVATGEFTVTHPIHPTVRLAAGAYQILIQATADMLRRAED